MPTTLPSRRLRVIVASTLVVAVAAIATRAQAQDDPSATTSTTVPEVTVPTVDPNASTTSVPPAPVGTPEDPGLAEGVGEEPVPVVPVTVPPKEVAPGQFQEAARVVRQELSVATAEAVRYGGSYHSARQRTIQLEAQLDVLEESVTSLASVDRSAVRRVEAARRHFETRAATATVRGRIDDFVPVSPSGDPNEIAIGRLLLGSVLDSDQQALQDYLAARAATQADLVVVADRLVETRKALADARANMVEARRKNVSAQINLAVLSAGSDIVIHGFVFPVGKPHTFGDSFGAPRMVGTEYAHAHQGTDIFAPMGTPLLACERGVISKIGSDVLGGNKLWLKGESGTYYYYAHLSAFAEGLTNGALVDSGEVIGYVGDTGNARGGSPHLHFEIHPDGGRAVNPAPLLRVVDRLNDQASAAGR